MTLKRREVLNVVLLSLVTCGIYSIYWLIVTTDDLNAMEDNPSNTSGLVCFLLSLVTCGIYTFFWYYRMGQRISRLNGNESLPLIGVLCALLSVGIVSQAIYQDEINKYLAK